MSQQPEADWAAMLDQQRTGFIVETVSRRYHETVVRELETTITGLEDEIERLRNGCPGYPGGTETHCFHDKQGVQECCQCDQQSP